MKKLTIRKIFDAAMGASIATACVAVLFWSTPVYATGFPYFNPCPEGQRPINIELIELDTWEKKGNKIPEMVSSGWYLHPYILYHEGEARAYQPMVKCGAF